MLPLVYPNFVLWSILNVFKNIDRRSLAEGLLIGTHFAIFFIYPLQYLSLGLAILYWVVAAVAGGLYMSMVFAPNHKGEEVIAGRPTIWTDQITLTRNLYYSPMSFMFFGGLDLQIEHHLFPTMSRYNYPRARYIVKKFCEDNNIRYYETSWWGSMGEIYRALKHESTQVRVKN